MGKIRKILNTADEREEHYSEMEDNKLASLEATLVRNYDRPTDLLTGVKCRATSVAKKHGF